MFNEVVTHGSFRAASKELKLSPSVVSHHVMRLEQHLGTALLYRSTRKISLTNDGAILYRSSQNMVEAARTGFNALQSKNDQPAGQLRVTLGSSMFERPPYVNYLAEFAKTYPKIKLQINFTDQRVGLPGSKFDVAIRSGGLEDSQYKAKKISEMGHAIIASPDYMKGRPSIKKIEDLESLDWIEPAQSSINNHLSFAQGNHCRINPNIVMELDNLFAMIEMVKNGVGVGILPDLMVEDDLKNGELINLLPPSWKTIPIPNYAVWPQNVPEGGITHLFVNFLAGKLKAHY